MHTCHAIGCEVAVEPEMLMCKRHWFVVPKKVRNRVWATYRPGQCDDMRPSEAWHVAADEAILFVARVEVDAAVGLRSKIFQLVSEHYRDETIAIKWFRSKNKAFGGVSPVTMFKLGRSKEVIDALTHETADRALRARDRPSTETKPQ